MPRCAAVDEGVGGCRVSYSSLINPHPNLQPFLHFDQGRVNRQAGTEMSPVQLRKSAFLLIMKINSKQQVVYVPCMYLSHPMILCWLSLGKFDETHEEYEIFLHFTLD
jgi:hypothetical protein